MDHVLSYPGYFPKLAEFRAYLLLYDRLSTIVPWNDQPRVLEQKPVAELQEALPDGAIGFFDPTAFFDLHWARQQTTGGYFDELTRKVLDEPPTAELAALVRSFAKQHARAITQADELFGPLRAAGWRYMSSSKLKDEFADQLFNQGLAIEVGETPLTETPLLIQPRLGDHLMSRLARDIASSNRIPPIASSGRNLGDLLVDAELSARDQRAQLLAVTLDVAIPGEIADLSVAQFCDIRESLSDTRSGLSSMVQDFMVDLNIDSEQDAKRFREQLEEQRSAIENRLARAQRAVRWREPVRFAVDIIAAAAGGAVAATTGVLGDVAEGMLAGSIGVVAAQPGTRLSTRMFPTDNQHVEQMAALRSSILKRDAAERRHQRNYNIWSGS